MTINKWRSELLHTHIKSQPGSLSHELGKYVAEPRHGAVACVGLRLRAWILAWILACMCAAVTG